MDYKLLNKIEDTIMACCIGGGPYEGIEIDRESIPAAEVVSYELSRLLDGVEISSKDWTTIAINVQAGLAIAAAKTMRILGACHDIGVVTNDDRKE